MTFAGFGEAFIYRAVSPERVVDAVRRIAGEVVELGPIRAGPGGRATVFAAGTVGEPEADEQSSDPLTYAVHLPVAVSIQVKVGTVSHFAAEGSIALQLTVGMAAPLTLLIDVAPITADDVRFRIEAKGVQARILGRAGDVDGELRRHTAAYVNERIGGPEAARLTRIDLVPLIESVWGDL